MANADGEVARHILIGVTSGGAVQDAPLPEDEAHLQDRLHAIRPMPNVAFTPLKLTTAGAEDMIYVPIHRG